MKYATLFLLFLFSGCSGGGTANNPQTNPLFNTFNIGFGGAYAFRFNSVDINKSVWVSSKDLILDPNIQINPVYSSIKNFNPSAFSQLQSYLKNTKFVMYWVPRGWSETWYDLKGIQALMNKGYIPVFIYFYFGDTLLNGIPTQSDVAAYTSDNQRLGTFLSKLQGDKMLIMEPEFNKNNILSTITNQHTFATIISNAITTIRTMTKNIYISLAMTDTGNRNVASTFATCGYVNCALGDKYEWGRSSVVYNDLLPQLDFISFQEIVGQFSRNPANPGTWNNPVPIAYKSGELGIDFLHTRIANLAQFLYNKYQKPVFLPYMSIMTATWTDSNANGKIETSEINPNGWEAKADLVYQNLMLNKSVLQKNRLFGLGVMELFDNPQHDIGGYQFGLNNEYHMGIIKSSAQDMIDKGINGDIVFKGNILNTLFVP